MRLHRLRVTAFQAFAASEEVDFDALSGAGLFLLRGDTGAGKTTLLDAVCFALYGEVPGARAREARLRSDHAAPDLRTEVELEVTLRERRFRIVRRPKQERPKVRGDGVTEEGHGCTVQELRDGDWITVAARPDEARAELADPLGMSCDQFCQVVLLPQGEFAAFLRAGSDERWKLLERLFGTERFAQVEWWLRDRARAARIELSGQLGAVRDIVARLAQASGEEPPEGWEVDPGSARDWAGGLSVGAQATAVTAQEAAVGARAARTAAESALAAATELAARQRQFADAEAELASWQAKRGVRDEAERVLAAARAAAPVAPLLEVASARADEAAAAHLDADAAWEALDEESREVAEGATAADASPSIAVIGTSGDASANADGDADAENGGIERGAEAGGADLGAVAPDAGPPTDALLPIADADPADGPTPAPQPLSLFDTLSLFDEPTSVDPPSSEDSESTEVPAAAAIFDPAAALRERAAELRTRAGAFGELVAVEQRLDDDERALAALLAEAEKATTRGEAAARALTDAERERERLESAAQAARRAADRLDALAAEEKSARERAERALERDRLAAAQTALDDRVRSAVDGEQAAHAAWLDLRERRLAGMAAELAAGLEPGEPCAVCGATDHPAPAHLRPASGAIDPITADPGPSEGHRSALIEAGAARDGARDAADAEAPREAARDAGAAAAPLAEQEQRAQEAHAARAEARAEAERAAAANASALAAARAVAGDGSADELQAAATRLAEQRAATAAEAGGLADIERSLSALATAVTEQERTRREAEQAAATARAAHGERSAALAAERERVASARGDAPSIAARVAALREQADACEHAAAAAEQATRATAAAEEAAAAAATAALAAGFTSTEDASTAVRADSQLTELEQRLRDFDEGIARRSALVQDPLLRAAAQEPTPELEPLREAAATAVRQDEESHGRTTVEQRRLAAITSLTGALDDALTALAPVAERERLVRELAALADGGSAANRLRMRLSAYVLAARLEEVAEAATARLERMSNGRYALIHADDGARGRRRGGLDLKIVDGWTGQERSPATLSGGETFLASLALALGLADVVAADAGGSRLETLFIDEGFGSLDERTLDEVLDVLDALREGGRAVGIVSHVAELRQRVPAQLLVVKGRDGSHVEQSAVTPAG